MAKLVLTDHPKWINDLEAFVKPYWQRILASPCVDGAAKGKISVDQMRGWILQLYPFIHTFPKFLAESLTKVEDEISREFLIDNIRVEKEHAKHWILMGLGFGLSKKSMIDLAEGQTPTLRDVQSLSDWIWYINTKGSLAEAVAATSYAIEGVTGDISRKVVEGFKYYQHKPGVHITDQTFKWMKEHAEYDDEHPKMALECIKLYGDTPKIQKRVMVAAKRSIQLLDQALDTCYRAYAPADQSKSVSRNGTNKRADDRRQAEMSIPFPNRRFRERRGLPFDIVA